MRYYYWSDYILDELGIKPIIFIFCFRLENWGLIDRFIIQTNLLYVILFIQHFSDGGEISVRLPDLLSTESRLRSRCRVSLGTRESSVGWQTKRKNGWENRRKEGRRMEWKAGRVKSDLTNQRVAASISTTHRFFSYPRPVFSFLHFFGVLFLPHRASKMKTRLKSISHKRKELDQYPLRLFPLVCCFRRFRWSFR